MEIVYTEISLSGVTPEQLVDLQKEGVIKSAIQENPGKTLTFTVVLAFSNTLPNPRTRYGKLLDHGGADDPN